LLVVHQQKLCGGSDGNAVDKSEAKDAGREVKEDLALGNNKHRSKSKMQPYLQRLPARAHLLRCS